MLRVLALSAPQFQRGSVGERALSSTDAASLYNACREAARAADSGSGAWAESNWAGGRWARRRTTYLFHDLPEALDSIEREVARFKPNLVLIGAMTICYRGAIECARAIKDLLGDQACVVLGGRHATETIWASGKGVSQHAASPVAHMAAGRIPPVFDVVISGDGEHVIRALGEVVARTVAEGRPAAAAREDLHDVVLQPGNWVLGALDKSDRPFFIRNARPIRYDELPTPAEAFGVTTRFSMYHSHARTAHVFSDVGQGCIYDCAFCSERISVVGRPRDFHNSATRLARNLLAAQHAIAADFPGAVATAFVEDSTLLGFNPKLVAQFHESMSSTGASIRFGGQATIDQILQRPDLLPTLKDSGLEYLFIGLETPDPAEIGGMSKDIGAKQGGWLDRGERVFEILTRHDIEPGISLLFGLGEGPQARELLFSRLRAWKQRFGVPNTISMNWAVKHPLRNQAEKPAYDYLQWAIDDDLLDSLRHFGEASTKYPMPGISAPILDEVNSIIYEVESITNNC